MKIKRGKFLIIKNKLFFIFQIKIYGLFFFLFPEKAYFYTQEFEKLEIPTPRLSFRGNPC